MATFTFLARDQQGQTVSGVRTASTREEAIAKLRGENLVATSVVPEGQETGRRCSLSEAMKGLFETPVRTGSLLVLARQLSAMLTAGVALTDTLRTVAHSVGNPRLRSILLQVRTDVQRGRTFTDALRQHPRVFDPLFLGIVHAGESSGGLAQNVHRLAEYLDRKEKFRRKLSSATAYPKFVIMFFLFMSAAILLFLLPRFREVFDKLGANLPPLTQGLLFASDLLRGYWFVWLPLIVLVPFAALIFKRTPEGKSIVDAIALRIPFFGQLMLNAAVARMSMTLSTLMSNGIPLTDALQIASESLNNTKLEEGFKSVRRDVMRGLGLAESLARVETMPRLLPRMVRVGEESGALSNMLEDVANYYDQEVDQALSRITVVIEPVLICGMGLVVLVTVLAIYQPIFNMSRAMRTGGAHMGGK